MQNKAFSDKQYFAIVKNPIKLFINFIFFHKHYWLLNPKSLKMRGFPLVSIKMHWNTFVILILSISIFLVDGQKEPKEDDDDKPKTVWDFIYKDWKQHLDSHMVDLPDLYALFAEGWVPPEKPKKKRSINENSHTEGGELDSVHLKDLEYFRDWIDGFIQMRKHSRMIENDNIDDESSLGRELINYIDEKNGLEKNVDSYKLKVNHDEKYHVDKRMSDPEEFSKLKKIQTEITANSGIEAKDGNHEELGEAEYSLFKAPNAHPIKISVEVNSQKSEVNSEALAHSQFLVDRGAEHLSESLSQDDQISTLREKIANIARRQERSLVEEVETPSYCKFFSKCVLTSCDCNNLRQIN